MAYQFFGKLHTVSHAQLCLIGRSGFRPLCGRHDPQNPQSLRGWVGSNGLWEEVGLGTEGESITFEPNLLLALRQRGFQDV